MASLKPCAHCDCYISVDEARCPFCDRVQRTTSSWPAWVLAVSLTGLGACVGGDDPEPKDTVADTVNPSGPDSVGNDTLEDTDDWGEGATYAGPDPTTTGSWETTTGYATDSATDTDTDSDDWGEGATYAGPDDTTSGGAATTTPDPDGGGSGSDGGTSGGR